METVEIAAQSIKNADSLLFSAGAGMGVDSGLPDFRGDEGFWRAYPPLGKLGLSFVEMANPQWFRRDPRLAWGFYGHRLNLYRATTPHAGFATLKRWSELKPASVYTSNVDGQFQKAGIEGVSEIHGSIAHLQCTQPCSNEIWSTPLKGIEVDGKSFRAVGALPECPHCGALARPNILMFSDSAWVADRSEAQNSRLREWLETLDFSRLAIVEMGAGTAIPSVRRFGETLQGYGASLIRINLRESQGPERTISVEMGACEALEQIETAIAALEDRQAGASEI